MKLKLLSFLGRRVTPVAGRLLSKASSLGASMWKASGGKFTAAYRSWRYAKLAHVARSSPHVWSAAKTISRLPTHGLHRVFLATSNQLTALATRFPALNTPAIQKAIMWLTSKQNSRMAAKWLVSYGITDALISGTMTTAEAISRVMSANPDLTHEEAAALVQSSLLLAEGDIDHLKLTDTNQRSGYTSYDVDDWGVMLKNFVYYNQDDQLKQLAAILSDSGKAVLICRLIAVIKGLSSSSDQAHSALMVLAIQALACEHPNPMPSATLDPLRTDFEGDIDFEACDAALVMLLGSITNVSSVAAQKFTTEMDSLVRNSMSAVGKDVVNKSTWNDDIAQWFALVQALTVVTYDNPTDGDDWYDRADEEENAALAYVQACCSPGVVVRAMQQYLMRGDADAFNSIFKR